MAYIEKRGANSYRIKVNTSSHITGKPAVHFLTYHPKETAPSKVKKELLAVAADFEARVKEGRIYSGEKSTFQDIARLWIRDYVKDNATLKTREEYERMLSRRILPVIGSLPIARISPLTVNDLYRSMIGEGRAASTVRRYHCVVSGVFRFAYKAGIIENNPCDRVTLPKLGRNYKYSIWTEDQIEVFFKALKGHFTTHVRERHRIDSKGNVYPVSAYDVERHISSMYYALFQLSIFSSCRRGEIACLTWEDIDFSRKELSVTKAVSLTKSEGVTIKAPKTSSGVRRITLPQRCISALKEWKKDEIRISFELGSKWEGYSGRDFDKNFIFIQKDSGKMIHADSIGSKFKEIVQYYNDSCEDPADRLPEIRLHDLRHTGASLLIANGVDVVTVSHRLGHAKPSTTMDIYSHAIPLKDQHASDVLDQLIGAN